MELFQNTLQLGVKRPVRYGMLKPIPKEALGSVIWIHVDSKFTIALLPAQYNFLPSPAEILRMIGHAWIPKSQDWHTSLFFALGHQRGGATSP